MKETRLREIQIIDFDFAPARLFCTHARAFVLWVDTMTIETDA